MRATASYRRFDAHGNASACRAQKEWRRHGQHGAHDPGARAGDTQSGGQQRPTQDALAPKSEQQRDPSHGVRNDEREIEQRSEECPSGKPATGDQIGDRSAAHDTQQRRHGRGRGRQSECIAQVAIRAELGQAVRRRRQPMPRRVRPETGESRSR